jgi:hypothetical protein
MWQPGEMPLTGEVGHSDKERGHIPLPAREEIRSIGWGKESSVKYEKVNRWRRKPG